MKTYKKIAIILNLVILLIYFGYSVVDKEELIKDGQLALLELAPVDPRSLMQGDYMALRYSLSEDLDLDAMPKRGYCVIVLDQKNRANKVRFQPDKTPLNANEFLIAYTITDFWNINIGAESFFFEEGSDKRYEEAQFGGIKIDNDGNSILVGLYDENLKQIN
ncbi:GDYXXLXY domain-containing protein [Leeuwenhoekiella nanhaiensis]|uniref:GDYXXLXY protein n=1 Tax=Leeuwenhoekiella nanhaiensis TaxID=1655491 RepID=A0A2G1VUF0_9FLAO|nr:GDYXXLXY domain-containing protein [Leeuwenhoekiella nanhaiensis]PHQ30412.1 hypothetical protein CJ305_05490 [Leeuwenhoekiella nanhaiensis]